MRMEGVSATLWRILDVVRDRVMPPWVNLYWIPAGEVSKAEKEEDLELHVVTSLDALGPAERRDLERSVGLSAIPIFEERLARGSELHILLASGRVAGTRFVVFGHTHPFQDVMLTEHDAMGLDVRIDPAFRGRGLASDFYRLSIANLAERGIERVFAGASVRNGRSNRMLRRVGFRSLLRYRVRRGRYQYDCRPIP